MTEVDNLLKEKSELNALINKGVTFDVEVDECRVTARFWGLVKRRETIRVKHTYKIEEPTLGTLDRLSAEWVEIAIDEAAIKADGLTYAHTMAHNHAIRCARIIAIAVMGSSYLIPKPTSSGVRYEENRKELDRLTALFARAIKPSTLNQLYLLISAMCNLGDFVSSIRLMCADRTTMPIRVEAKG